jgi:hypothetical protein
MFPVITRRDSPHATIIFKSAFSDVVGSDFDMYVCICVFIQRISLVVHVNHLASVKREAYTSYNWHW